LPTNDGVLTPGSAKNNAGNGNNGDVAEGRHLATEIDDGSWDVPVNDEAAFQLAQERLSTENDDEVVSRLAQAEIGTRSG